jgi:hypothetical protein
VQELCFEFCEEVKLMRSSVSLHRESARSEPEVKYLKYQSSGEVAFSKTEEDSKESTPKIRRCKG